MSKPINEIGEISPTHLRKLKKFDIMAMPKALDEIIESATSDMETTPLEFTSRDILDELKNNIENYEEIIEVKKVLAALLDEFAKNKFGVPMDEETRKFLRNELVFLVLKLRSRPTYAENLANIGINTVHALLGKGCTRSGRKELADKTGISETLILEWVNMADLFRIEGIGEEYSSLLEDAGVDTVVELSKRVPENLHAKLKEVNEQKNLVRQLPTLEMVKKWIEQAKKLPRIVEY